MLIKINVPKTDSKGGIVLNKITKKPAMAWVKYDPKTDYGLSLRRAEEAREEALSTPPKQGK